MASGIGGQPEMLITGLSVMISDTGTAPVGFGCACGMPPNAAQVPTEISANACSAVSLSTCRLVLPAFVEYTPPSLVETEPSTTRSYLPLFSRIDVRRASSAAAPDTACKVS